MSGISKKSQLPEWIQGMVLPDILMNLVYFFLLQAIGTMFMAFEPNLYEKYFLIIWLLIPMALMFVWRRLVMTVVPMLIGHLVIALLPLFFLWSIDIRVSFWMETVTICMMFYSIARKYRKTFVVASLLLVIITVVVHFALLVVILFYQENALMPFVFSAVLISICFYMAAKQMLDFESSFEHFLSSPTQPGKQIEANNHRIISILLIATIIIIPISLMIPYDAILQVLEKIGLFITGLFFFLLSLVPTLKTFGYDENIESTDAEVTEPNEQLTQLFAVFEIIIAILILLFLLIALWKGLIRLILYLRDNYVQKHRTVVFAENENVTDEIFQLDAKISRKKKAIRHDFGQGDERRIRRAYYDTIRKAIAKGLSWKRSSSPAEISNEMKNQFGMDISELTTEYEKVRYGNNRNDKL